MCIPSGQRQASGYFLWKQQLSSFATTAEHECNGTKAGKIYERPPLHAKGRHVNVSITRAACRENRALIPVLKLVTPPPFWSRNDRFVDCNYIAKNMSCLVAHDHEKVFIIIKKTGKYERLFNYLFRYPRFRYRRCKKKWLLHEENYFLTSSFRYVLFFFIPFFRVCNRIFGESTIITQLQREHRRFVQKIGARQRVKIAGTRAANWKGRKKLRHARRRHGSDNTCLETFIYWRGWHENMHTPSWTHVRYPS